MFRAYWVVIAAGLLCSAFVVDRSVAQGFAPAGPCDALAAHPDDPYRVHATGVSDDTLDVAKARAACSKALTQYPKTARLQFQLGRVYALMGNVAQAGEQLSQAHKHGYLPAGAYLGYILGHSTSAKDVARGKKLISDAHQAGFRPTLTFRVERADAETRSGEQAAASTSQTPKADVIEKSAKVKPRVDYVAEAKRKYLRKVAVAPPPRMPNFAGEGFAKPQILDVLNRGEFSKINRRNLLNVYYFQFLNEVMSTKGIGQSEPSCLRLYDTTLAYTLSRTAMEAAGLTGNGMQMGQRGFQMLAEMMRGIQRRGAEAIIAPAARRHEYEEGGKTDAVRLAQRFGCGHPAVVRIYQNMGRLLRGRSALLPAGVVAQQRLRELHKRAKSSCNARFGQGRFCRCVVDRLRAAPLNENAWGELAARFERIAHVVVALDAPRQHLKACYQN